MKKGSKTIILIFLSCFVVLSNLYSQQLIPPPWTYTNTGNNHIILISNFVQPAINEVPADSGDYLGVFYDSLGTLVCAGYTQWENAVTAVAAWGEESGNDGFKAGETFKWKIWDASLGKEFRAIATFNGEDFPNYDSYASNGMSGLESLNAYPEQDISFYEGWNFYSSYIDPLSPEWPDLFSEIDSFIIVNKDYSGELTWPVIKNTDQYNAAESYLIKVSEDIDLNLWGKQMNPEDTVFELVPGVNILPYIRTEEADMLLLLDSVLENIRLIKSIDGFCYWPEMNMKNLGNFYPGEAFVVVSYDAINFSYPSNESILPIAFVSPQPEADFYSHDLRTGNSMFLGIKDTAWNIELETGDEIGVFSENGNLVGSGVYNNEDLGIIIWGDDETTTEIEALQSGNSFKLKLRHASDGFEDIVNIITWLEGDSIYEKDKISILGKVDIYQAPEERMYNMEVTANYLTSTYEFEISVPENTVSEINLFDINGRFVRQLLHQNLERGKHYFNILINDLPTGVYIVNFESSKIKMVKQIAILKDWN